MRPSDLLLDFGRPVAYYPGLVKSMGSPHAVIFFSQIFYWQDKAFSEFGVHKTREAIEQETGLSFEQQATARKQLVSRGILIETNRRLEHKIYYRIDCEKLDEIITGNASVSRNKESTFPETGKPVFGESGNPSSGGGETPRRGSVDPDFDPSEITTEITTEINNGRENAGNKKSQPAPTKNKTKKYAMPEDFSPTEKHRELSQEIGVDLQEEFQKFTDYHLSKGSLFADWGRALNTWLRNAKTFRGGYQRQQQPPQTRGGFCQLPDGTFIVDR